MATKSKVEMPVDTVAVAMAKNGNATEDIWLSEFQRVAGPDATVSNVSATLLHTLRQNRYVITTDTTYE